MTICTDTGKAFIMKILDELGTEGSFVNLIKDICQSRELTWLTLGLRPAKGLNLHVGHLGSFQMLLLLGFSPEPLSHTVLSGSPDVSVS